MRLVVGRIGRAHGVRGDVFVEPFTDEPEQRFASGNVLELGAGGALTVGQMRWHSGKMLVHFVGVEDRSSAEGLRGGELIVDADPAQLPDDPDEFYDYQLTGLAVRLVDGTHVGTIAEVVHLPGQEVLAVDRPDGTQTLVPFVTAIVPDVDLLEGSVTITPPPGLLNEGDAVVVQEEQ